MNHAGRAWTLFGAGAGASASATIRYWPAGAAAILEAGGTLEPETPEGGTEQPGTVVTDDVTELIRLANEAYESAQESQRAGDWAGYGQFMEQLQQYLQQLAQ